MFHVLRDLTVKDRKDFHAHQKYTDYQSIGNNLGQRLHRLFSGIEPGEFSQDKAKQDQECRSGSKGRSQKTGSHDGGQPETPPR